MTSGRILIVDDSEINVEILKEILADSYQLATASTGQQCLEVMREFCPDLVLLDVMMPGISGYEVCRQIKSSPVGAFTQVILVSGKASKTERLEGYAAGADDYVIKPFDHDELLAKVRVQFRLRAALAKVWEADAKLRAFNEDLERLVEERTAQVVGMRDLTIFALARLAESRDPETGAHLERIRNYSKILAEQLSMQGPYTGQIDDAFIGDIYRSSPLHDIGKVGIPDAILLKAGRLTREEFEVMKRHTIIGAETLEQAARQAVGCGHFLTMAREVARHHHERFDGSGYPDGLAGDDIPLSARIVSLADVYDALTTRRVYKEAFTPETAWSIIEEGRGTQFDPAVYEAFAARREDFLAVHEESERLAAAELAAVSALDAGR
jgi:putative two-component system response regulator